MHPDPYSDNEGSCTASSSGDVTWTEGSSNSEPAPPTTKYGRFDLEEVPVGDGLDFLIDAVPITVPEEIALQFLAGDMAPLLVYNKQKRMLQIGVKPWQGVSVELNGTMLPPEVLADLHHGALVRLAFRVANANFSYVYRYRERHVFVSPGPGGVHYVELGVLGTGAYGIVRRCRLIGDYGIFGHEPFETGDVAVKVVDLPENVKMAEVVREVHFLKTLNDVPGFVRLHESWGDSDLGEMYIAMQLASLGCIRRFIRQYPHYVHEDEARHFAFYALKAIEAMHALDIIHGDLKPANFLYASGPGQRLRGVISDLGGAKHTSELQQAHVYVGGYSEDAKSRVGKPSAWTRGYSAPEMGKPDADARAHDMHCFGATLFELMTKKKLFSEEHYCKRANCTDAACPGRRRVYHFTQLRDGNYSAQAYVFIKQLVFPSSPRLSAAQALAHPWLTMPGDAMMPLAPDFVDETAFNFDRDAYIARVEGRHGRVAGPAPSRTETPSKESGQSKPEAENRMDTDEQLYGPAVDESATEDTSASFRVSMDGLEVGQEMHVWKIEHYRHDAARVAPTMDEWQVQLQANAAAEPQEGAAAQP